MAQYKTIERLDSTVRNVTTKDVKQFDLMLIDFTKYIYQHAVANQFSKHVKLLAFVWALLRSFVEFNRFIIECSHQSHNTTLKIFSVFRKKNYKNSYFSLCPSSHTNQLLTFLRTLIKKNEFSGNVQLQCTRVPWRAWTNKIKKFPSFEKNWLATPIKRSQQVLRLLRAFFWKKEKAPMSLLRTILSETNDWATVWQD